MSDYSTLRGTIATAVGTVTNVGLVYTRERLISDQTRWMEAFVSEISSTRQARGWVITLDDGLSSEFSSFGKAERRYNFVIYGIMGAQDSTSTEHTFYDLLEAVMDALDDMSATMGLSGIVVGDHGPAQARNVGYRQFGSVLCHYGEITYSVGVDKS